MSYQGQGFILFLNRTTGEAFVCQPRGEEHLRKMIFASGRRDEKLFDRMPFLVEQPIRIRALGEKKLDVTTLESFLESRRD